MNKNSPFFIIQDFISPMMTEDMIDTLNFNSPDTNLEGKPTLSVRFNENLDDVIFEKLQKIIPEVESHYGIEYAGTEPPMSYEYYAQDYNTTDLHAENSVHLKGKWLRTKNRDITGIIFLSDYNEKPPFSSEFEVYGGKLEFPQHTFSFNPERGTMVLFPSDPHFINNISPVTVGDCYMVRFHLVSKTPYLYDHTKFEGDYKTWFLDIA